MTEHTHDDFEITTIEDLVRYKSKSPEEIQEILRRVQGLDDKTWKERPEKGTEKPVGAKYYEYVGFQSYHLLNPNDLPESVLVVAINKEGEVGGYIGAYPVDYRALIVGVVSGYKDPNKLELGYNKSFPPWDHNPKELYREEGQSQNIVGFAVAEKYQRIGIGNSIINKFLSKSQEQEIITHAIVICNHRHSVLRNPNKVWGRYKFKPVVDTWDSTWRYHIKKPEVGGTIWAVETPKRIIPESPLIPGDYLLRDLTRTNQK